MVLENSQISHLNERNNNQVNEHFEQIKRMLENQYGKAITKRLITPRKLGIAPFEKEAKDILNYFKPENSRLLKLKFSYEKIYNLKNKIGLSLLGAIIPHLKLGTKPCFFVESSESDIRNFLSLNSLAKQKTLRRRKK